MEESIEVKSPAIEEIEDETSDLYGKPPAEITAIRGRLIRKIKQEINKIKNKENATDDELKAVEELELRLNDLLQDHKAQLGERYDKEFIKQKADLKSLITVLPKAVGLSAKMVANCVSELKQAKTNKARIFKSIELLKSIGLFAATPVIYTVKFIANHWYLIFLLLLLLKLPNINWKGKGKEKPDPQMETAPEYETVPVEEPDHVIIAEPEQEPVPGVVPNPQPEPVPGVEPRPVPGLVPKPGVRPEVAIQPETDTGTGTPRVEVQPEPEVIPNPVVETEPAIGIVPELEGEALEQAREVYDNFFNYLNDQRYNFIIAEQNPNITIVHNAQEFIDYVKGINPYVVINDEAAALRVYESSLVGTPDPSEMGVYWVNSGSDLDYYHFFETSQQFADYIINGEEPALTDLFNRYVNGATSFSIPFELQSAVDAFSKNLGISSQAALVLFLIYEAAQYGLAAPTGGLSMLLPG